jgi:hypothetical protein
MTTEQHDEHRRSSWVLPAFLVVAAFFLFTEHRAHLFGVLPYLLLLACPLMHLFMHRTHGSHGGHGGHRAHRHHGPTNQPEAEGQRPPKREEDS